MKIKLWKLESWKSFEDGIFKKIIIIIKIIMIIIIIMIMIIILIIMIIIKIIINKCENWKLNLKIGILKNYLKMKF